MSAGCGAAAMQDLSFSAARGLAAPQVRCGWVWPHHTGPLSRARQALTAQPAAPVKRGYTRSAPRLGAAVLPGLASALADAQEAMINCVPPKHLGFLSQHCDKRCVCGAELAEEQTRSMRAGAPRCSELRGPCPPSPCCPLSQFAARLEHIYRLGYTGLTSAASGRNISCWDAKLRQRHSGHRGRLLDEPPVPEGASKHHVSREACVLGVLLGWSPQQECRRVSCGHSLWPTILPSQIFPTDRL